MVGAVIWPTTTAMTRSVGIHNRLHNARPTLSIWSADGADVARALELHGYLLPQASASKCDGHPLARLFLMASWQCMGRSNGHLPITDTGVLHQST